MNWHQNNVNSWHQLAINHGSKMKVFYDVNCRYQIDINCWHQIDVAHCPQLYFNPPKLSPILCASGHFLDIFLTSYWPRANVHIFRISHQHDVKTRYVDVVPWYWPTVDINVRCAHLDRVFNQYWFNVEVVDNLYISSTL